MKQILNTILAAAALLALYSCGEENSNGGLPTVTTLEVQKVSSSTAVLRGSTRGGVDNMICRGVCFSESEIFSFKDSPCVSTDAGEGEFEIRTYELKSLTKYHIKAFAVMNDGEIVYGEALEFSTTDFSLPSVSIDPVSGINATEATFSGALVDEGDCEVSSFGFVYAPKGSYSALEIGQSGVISVMAETEDGESFSYTSTELAVNTTYDIRAFANCEQGTGYSEVISFSTPDVKPVLFDAITVTENDYTALSIKSAITDAQGSTVTAFGFVWSTEEKSPSLGNSTRVDLTDQNDMAYSFENVHAGTVYYIRAFAQTNEIGNCYSSVLKVRVKTYDCNGGMITISPKNPVYIGWLGDYEQPSMPAKYLGAHDGDFIVNQSVNRSSSPVPSEANVKPFCIAKYEVTNRDFLEWLNFSKSTGTIAEGSFQGRAIFFSGYSDITYDGTKWVCDENYLDCPVVGVTFFGASAFCEFFGGYLPNEAQWEIAARGNYYSDDPAAPMFRYSGSDTLEDVAVCSTKGSVAHCQPVGSKKPNQLGIYDMSGNAQEMTRSGWGNYSATYTDVAWSSKNQITVRGGRAQRGVANTFQNCTRDALDILNPQAYSNYIGFRFACDPQDED